MEAESEGADAVHGANRCGRLAYPVRGYEICAAVLRHLPLTLPGVSAAADERAKLDFRCNQTEVPPLHTLGGFEFAVRIDAREPLAGILMLDLALFTYSGRY
ncbi:hypothetical protein KM043_013045 [Ampulex compressa]|nr:hypothetical protein KM043_013045 [Ampulex compressa]